MNPNVNNLKGSTSQTVTGWTLDGLTNGPWNTAGASIGCSSWFGSGINGEDGSIIVVE